MVDSILVDASNLRNGGGVQVAASLIDEMIEMAQDARCVMRWNWLDELHVHTNQKVFDSLTPRSKDFSRLVVRECRPTSWRRWLPQSRKFQVSFVIFGPEYGMPRARRRIVGYADVRSIYPSPEGEGLPTRERLRWWARGIVSRGLLHRADAVVVETSEIRARLNGFGIAPRSGIHVISNCCNSIFERPDEWAPLELARRDVDCDYLLVYVARPYSHKNLDFLPAVRKATKAHHGLSIKFLTTLTDEEWSARSSEFREATHNVGVMPIQQVPSLYRVADAAFFPSLLEAFSVMPLEAMRMGRVVFASDRPFVRSTCGDGAVYIDPLDPVATSATLARWLPDEAAMALQCQIGLSKVKELPTATDRARAVAELIQCELEK